MDAYQPDYSGESCQEELPDTLDLADRASFAINGMGGASDPDQENLMYFMVQYACQPPYMAHHSADMTCTPKFAESFPMLRLMSGSNQYLQLETEQRRALVRHIDDGLYWNNYNPSRPWAYTYNPAFDGNIQPEDVSNMGGMGRMLRALVTLYEVDPSPQVETKIQELVGGLKRVAIDKDDYCFYPDAGFGEAFNYPRSGWRHTREPESETEGAEGSVVTYQSHQIQGLMRWVQLSGDEQALDLAHKLTRFVTKPKLWGGLPDADGERNPLLGHVAPRLPDPACVSGDEQGHWYSHFHARAIGLRGILEYARTVGDLRLLEFIQRAFEYTMTFGIPRMGWINCYPAAVNLCEGCALGDLVALGIRLTDAGMGDYWDFVDGVVRNHLVEQQFTDADALLQISHAGQTYHPEEKGWAPGQAVWDDDRLHSLVIQRTLGNFGGQSTPTSVPNTWVMQCCTGNATQGLYYAWEGALRETKTSAQVNLLLNRTGKLVDVNSCLPHEGKVTIRNKSANRISVRIPNWVKRQDIQANIGTQPRELEWTGNFLLFSDLKPEDRLVIQFPVTETTNTYTVNTRTKDETIYTTTFRGATLVDISPRDQSPTSYPMYRREHMRSSITPYKAATRFSANKTIKHW